MKELSILIPARNEMFLKNTIEDIIKNAEADTEIIAVLDGAWADPAIDQHPMVNIIYLDKSIGMRAATNLACRLADGKYIMKVDAHCSFDKGFDRKMLDMFKKTGDNVTAVPVMRNLWAFDWKCYKCGKKWYQGGKPNKCDQCGHRRYIKRKMMWVGKHNPASTSFYFDIRPQFGYFEDWKHREPYTSDKKNNMITETMSLQGSCFMMTREKYWELNICDESFGNWGNQGIEVAVKTWLSGGRVVVNHNTWYAHLFRTQTDFGFPWPVSGKAQKETKKNVRDFLWSQTWDKQIRPLSWLIEKFMPVPSWNQEEIDKLKVNEVRFK